MTESGWPALTGSHLDLDAGIGLVHRIVEARPHGHGGVVREVCRRVGLFYALTTHVPLTDKPVTCFACLAGEDGSP